MTIALQAYAAFVDTVPDATLVVDPAGRIVVANSVAESMFGYASGAMVGLPVRELVPHASREAHARHEHAYSQQGAHRAMGHAGKMNLRGLRRDGSELAVDIMLRPMMLDGTRHTICVVRDISALQRTQQALEQALERERELAYTDPVTGATNVRHFHESLQRELQRFRRYERPFTLVYMDLDHFKAVNDALGHQAGDEVLRSVVKCLQGRLRSTDCVARLGGDEFALLLPETGVDLAATLLGQLRQHLLEEMERRGWPITFSIGVVTCTELPADMDVLLKQADGLMYAAKRGGRNAVRQGVFLKAV